MANSISWSNSFVCVDKGLNYFNRGITMENMITSIYRGIAAAANYFAAAVTLAIKNPWLLALTALMLISSGKSLKIGRAFSVKG